MKPTSKTYITDAYITAILISYIGCDGHPVDRLKDKLWSQFRAKHRSWSIDKMDSWYEKASKELLGRIERISEDIKLAIERGSK